MPREDPNSNSPSKSPKRDLKQNSSQNGYDKKLKIDQRVVTFIEDYPARGIVRYIGQEKDSSGNLQTIVGLEMVGINSH